MSDVPSGVVTVTSTVPVPGGELAVIELAESDVMSAAAEPKSTAVAPARFVPVMVTLVPPAGVPEPGDTRSPWARSTRWSSWPGRRARA